MVNNMHKIRTNYTDFTCIIKVSNSSKNNSLSCISKMREMKRNRVSHCKGHPFFLYTPNNYQVIIIQVFVY